MTKYWSSSPATQFPLTEVLALCLDVVLVTRPDVNDCGLPVVSGACRALSVIETYLIFASATREHFKSRNAIRQRHGEGKGSVEWRHLSDIGRRTWVQQTGNENRLVCEAVVVRTDELEKK